MWAGGGTPGRIFSYDLQKPPIERTNYGPAQAAAGCPHHSAKLWVKIWTQVDWSGLCCAVQKPSKHIDSRADIFNLQVDNNIKFDHNLEF